MKDSEKHDLVDILEGHPLEVRPKLKAYLERVEIEEDKPKRTSQQNKALHKFFELVAQALDQNGHTMQDVVKAIRKAEITPTKDAVKEMVWKPLQKVVLGKESTTELTTEEIDRVYEPLNKWLALEFQIHVPFPSDERKQQDAFYDVRSDPNYPEDPDRLYPTI